MLRQGVYYRLMAAQAEDHAEGGFEINDGNPIQIDTRDTPTFNEDAQFAATEAIVKAEGLGWAGTTRELMKHILPYRRKLALTFTFGVTRVIAFIGIGSVSALAVRAVKTGEPFMDLLMFLAALAPVAGIFHWLESWHSACSRRCALRASRSSPDWLRPTWFAGAQVIWWRWQRTMSKP